MWHEFKMLFVNGFGFTPEQLHLVLGIVIFGLLLGILRRPVLSLGVLFGVQALNEIVDLLEDRAGGRSLSFSSTIWDVIWTVVLPAVFVLAIHNLKLPAGSDQD